MNRILITGAAVLLLIATALGGFWLGARQQPPGDGATANSDGGKPSEPEVLYWYDPMMPGEHFDKPGKSPFMDMQLVPKYADAGSSDDASEGIRIDPRLVQNLGVRSVLIARGKLDQRIHAVGSVTFDADRMRRVTAPVDGIVQTLSRRSDLLPVKRGETLAKLLAPDWASAQSEYLSLLTSTDQQSQTSKEALQPLLAASRSRLILLGMPDSAIRRLESQRRLDQSVWLQSPIDGVIASVDAAEGDTLRRGDPLFSINGLDRVWIDAEIDGADAGAVFADAVVRVAVDTLPGQSFEGQVLAVLPAVDASTRRRRVRVSVPNPDHTLVPGMYASLDFAPSESVRGLLLPTEALIVTGTRRAVVVRDGEDRFRVVDVLTGGSDQQHTLVTRGLSEGDRVVISGQFLIDSEASLRQQGTRFDDAAADGSGSHDSHDMHEKAEAEPAAHDMSEMGGMSHAEHMKHMQSMQKDESTHAGHGADNQDDSP